MTEEIIGEVEIKPEDLVFTTEGAEGSSTKKNICEVLDDMDSRIQELENCKEVDFHRVVFRCYQSHDAGQPIKEIKITLSKLFDDPLFAEVLIRALKDAS